MSPSPESLDILPLPTPAESGSAAVDLMFSPLEAKIVAAVEGCSRALYGKEIAKRLNRGYDCELKTALQTLVARRVLAHARGIGYTRRRF